MLIPKQTKLLLLIFFSAYSLLFDAQNSNAVCTEKTIVYKFTSCLDGQDDFYVWSIGNLLPALAVKKPTGKTGLGNKQSANTPDDTLLVYFHSLKEDFDELFKSGLGQEINKTFPALSLLSCNYGRTPSWGNAVSRIDITNNLRHIMIQSNVKHIVLVGTSMGACAALTYAATAPTYIKKKIIGIVAVAPCADLDDLYQQSLAPEVKPSLEAALGGSVTDKPAFYHQNSLDSCLAFLPQPIKIAIIAAKEDTYVPIALQMNVVRDLNNRDMNVKSLETDGKSEPPPIESIMAGLQFVFQ